MHRNSTFWILLFLSISACALLLSVIPSMEGAESAGQLSEGAKWDTLAASEQYAEERVIDLPMDSQKWYISVIGDPDDARFKRILLQFDRNEYLKNLKSQVHFWVVPTDGPAYGARYEKNTKVVPAIRVQQSNGNVVWEAASGEIPATPGGLYAAIRNSSLRAMAILPWRRNGTVLPWRYKMENDCPDNVCPVPQPTPLVPLPVDPKPAPINDGGPPEFEEDTTPWWLVAILAVFSSLAGGGGSIVMQLRKSSASE